MLFLVDQGQEEYIWAMRYRFREIEQKSTETAVVKARHDQITTEQHNDDHQTKILASLVPDEIIYNVNDYSHRNYECCLLFGDVSGNSRIT